MKREVINYVRMDLSRLYCIKHKKKKKKYHNKLICVETIMASIIIVIDFNIIINTIVGTFRY